MNDERIIPIKGDASTVTYTLLVDGSELPPSVEVLSIVTEKDVNRVPFARLTLRDGDAAAEDFPLSNGAELIPGGELEIKLGYSSEEETVFKGLVVKHAIQVRGRGSSALVIECRDAAVKMTVGRRSRYFVDKTDSDVMKTLIGDHNLDATVATTSPSHPDLIQYHVSDWDFLVSRADANGLLVIADDGSITVEAPTFGGSPDLSIVFGNTIYEFDAEIDARRQYASVRAYSWDYSKQAVAGKDGRAAGANPQGNLSESALSSTLALDEFALRHGGRLNDQELTTWAGAFLTRSALAKIVGRARILGFSEIKPGQIVEVSGVGERFNGTGFVAGVRHEVVRGEWHTDVQFGLPPEPFSRRPDIVDTAAGGLVPGVLGLQVGVATALEGDPDGEDRIKVVLPLVDDQADGIWARWAAPDAGDERGVFFRPEIGDELIVGFVNQDPRDPVVLGMLHSKNKAAPIQLSDDNHEKAIVTRSKMRLHFDDDKKIITIETPGKNKAVISDDEKLIKFEDQHGNSITMDSDGITLDGSKITLKAQQEVAIEAGTDLKAKSGTGTEIKAGTQFKAEGSAGAELTTSAIATIKGSLVKIN